MKKTWSEAKMEELEIRETAGGPILNNTQDGETWWNKDQNRWEKPFGEGENDDFAS